MRDRLPINGLGGAFKVEGELQVLGTVAAAPLLVVSADIRAGR
jgi:hypothetical protein